jgi:hypothetical protein
MKDGIDVSAFVDNVLEKIGEYNIGKFYKEKIFSLRNPIVRNIPSTNEDIYIEKELYGYRLVLGKNRPLFKSEDEATYAKVFAEIGLTEIIIPKDSNELKSILPQLIKLKEHADKIINAYLESIVNKKLKDKLKNAIWKRIF